MNHLTTDSSGTVDPTLLQFTWRTVVVAMRCWWKAVIPAALGCALLAAGTVFLLQKPRYTADAWLLIKNKPDVILREIDSGSQRFIQNQLEIIRSPRLLGPLASNPEIASTPELRYEQDIPRTLAKLLKTTPRGDSDIYVVSFTSSSPKHAELIVREVVDAYLAFNRKLDTEQQNQILRLLQDQRDARYQEMNDLREKVRTLSMDLSGVDPFSKSSVNREQSKADSSIAALQTDIVRYEVAQDILAAHIRAEEEKEGLAKGELPIEEKQAIEKQIEKDETNLAFEQRLDYLRKKKAGFQRTSQQLEKNAAYKQLMAELEAEEEDQQAWAQQIRDELTAAAVRARDVAASEKLKALQTEFALGATRLKILNQKFEERLQDAKRVAGDSLGLEFHRAKLEQVTKIHDEISSRILAITTEQRAPERVLPFKEATLPIRPDDTVLWKNMGLAGGFGFLLPFGLVILFEHFCPRVSSRHQLIQGHRIPVVGEVAAVPCRPRRLSGHSARHRAAILFEESVDSLRTYLSLVEPVQDLRVMAITSAISGEGKSSLSSQLAISLERASGERTLIIDGDMRFPTQHERFGVAVGPGLAEVLSKKCSLEEAIVASPIHSVFVLPAGYLAESPHRLLNNGSFAELLQRLRTQFRHVIIDTPPLLPASEALVMARAADASVLCMRRDYSRLDQVQEAHERLEAAKVHVLGGVLNGIPLSHYTRKYTDYAGRSRPAAAVSAAT
jgi:capsular exopolysaccharide synthesis family protein